MPRKQKIPVRPMEDAMKGVGAIPTQELVEHSRSYGGAICSICRHHIDIIDSDDESQSDIEKKLEGGGYLSKAAEKVEKVSRKSASKVKKAGKATGKYVTSVDGLASDVVNYGIPAVGSATLGALGSATGNPAVGIAASALGAKLGTMAADKIADETVIQSRYEGGGVRRKGRFEKGSEAAKEHMRMLREKRLKKLMK
jgi:hypothetical protein